MSSWPPDEVEYANVLRYLDNLRLIDVSLPKPDPRLEVFFLPPSHRGFPGRGVRATDDIPGGIEIIHYAGV